MRKAAHHFITFLLSLGALAALMWISSWQLPSFDKVEVSFNKGVYKAITLPFRQPYVGAYRIRMSISGIASTKYRVRIYPDDRIDSLSVNGNSISLKEFTYSQRGDYASGFVVELNHLVPDQINVVEASLHNASTPAGFRMEILPRLSKAQLFAIYIILAMLVFILKRHLPINTVQTALVLMSLILSTFYLSSTDERTRTFDVFEGGGHMDYIEYLIKHRQLPLPGEGWEYHQPPLYYVSAAFAKQIAQLGNSTGSYLWAQLYGLYLWVLFLISGLAVLRMGFYRHPRVIVLASITLCLWPAGIIHSIRIGNDLALYATYGLAFFYIVKWWKNRSSQTLFWASLWMAAAVMSKSNGLAVAAVLGLLMLIHSYHVVCKPVIFQQHKAKLLRDMMIAGGLFSAAILLNFADNIKHYMDGTSEDWLLSNVSEMINPGLKVENHWKNYLIFDLATFVEQPFTSTWDDRYGRQYFWNFLLRSSLTSEFSFNAEGMEVWGRINGVLLLIAIAGAIIYFLQMQPNFSCSQVRRVAYRNAPWLIAIFFPLALLLAYRIKVPFSSNTDFRYIYPIILPIIFFTLKSWSSSTQLPIPKIMTLAAPVIGLNSIIWIYLFLSGGDGY